MMNCHQSIKKKIKNKIIGDLEKFPKRLKNKLKLVEKKTSNNSLLQINLALNYGSRQEITNTVNKLIKKNEIVTENKISNNLYTAKIPDPDILIRTGNTNRLSNFLLWQLEYSEIFFVKKLWPDFKRNDLYKIIKKFNKIKRNFGGL